jgi:hypothetical protein
MGKNSLELEATVAEATGKFFRVQLVWKAQVNAARVIQNLDLRGRKGQVEACEIILQLTRSRAIFFTTQAVEISLPLCW